MIRYALIATLILGVRAACAAESSDEVNAILASYETDPHGDLQSVIVMQDGARIAERYYNDANRQTLVDVRSAGKSVTSLLVGIATDRQAIDSLEDPVEKYWPEAAGSAVGPVRLDDILTMRSGLDADGDDPSSPGYEDFMDASDDPLAWALTIGRKDEPGTRYRYNSLTAYVAGVVITRATGNGLEEFARDTLFTPLGIERWDWQEDRSGMTKGQGNLFLTARGFAAIGQMVLDGGTYQGQQVVSRAWIDASLTPKVDISASTSNATGYGYYWYQHSYPVNGRPIEIFFASGNGGNKIYIVPAFDLVVTVMSTAYGQGRGHRRSEAILQAILAAQSPR